jgi:8-oxo-dGTP diphosphatase
MEEKTLPLATLNFLMEKESVWLAIKARKIGKGCRNGYGGGIELEDKDLINSAIREIKQESSVIASPENFEKMAIVYFHNTKSDNTVFICEVHVYIVRNWKGTPKETEEMLDQKLYDIKNLPLNEMMPADKEWVPLVMQGKKLIAEYYYGPFQKKLIKKGSLKIVDFLPD